MCCCQLSATRLLKVISHFVNIHIKNIRIIVVHVDEHSARQTRFFHRSDMVTVCMYIKLY